MDSPCPESYQLARFTLGELETADRAGIRRHLAQCEECRSAVAQGVHAAALDGMSAAPRSAGGRRRAWLIAAGAAVLVVLALAGLAAWFKSRGGSASAEGSLGDRRDVSLGDGTRLVFSEGTRAKAVPPADGERYHLRVEEGEVTADVAPSDDAFRISSEAGEIRVVGTRLRVRAFSLCQPGPDPEGPFAMGPVLCMELYQGKVKVAAGGVEEPAQAPVRIMLYRGERIRQDLAGAWETALDHFLHVLRPGEEGLELRRPEDQRGACLIAATFWGAGWGPNWDWRAALRSKTDPVSQAAAALLVGLRAPSGSVAFLRELCSPDAEESVRREAARAAAAIVRHRGAEGREACRFLKELVEQDPSESIRELAAECGKILAQ